jgi:hypothetical protein
MDYKKPADTAGELKEVPLLPIGRIYFMINDENCVRQIYPEQNFSHKLSFYIINDIAF